VAYEACDSGLLSPELGAGIRRVKGVRRLGVRVGNWLTPAQCKLLPERSDIATLRGKRNHAILAMLIGCGRRRGELLSLAMDSIRVREEHWVIADLKGKEGHIRTVPVPQWVKAAVDGWSTAAGITKGVVPLDQQVRQRMGRRQDAEGAVGGRKGSCQPRGNPEARAA
jgi:integrase